MKADITPQATTQLMFDRDRALHAANVATERASWQRLKDIYGQSDKQIHAMEMHARYIMQRQADGDPPTEDDWRFAAQHQHEVARACTNLLGWKQEREKYWGKTKGELTSIILLGISAFMILFSLINIIWRSVT